MNTYSFLFLLALPCFVLCDLLHKEESPIELAISTASPDMKVRIFKWDQCKDFPNSNIFFKNLTLLRTGKDEYTINGAMRLNKSMDGPIYPYYKVQKCSDLSVPTTCRHLAEDSLEKDICEDFKDKESMMYKLFHDHFNIPVPACPMKPITTRMIPKKVDVTPFMGPVKLAGRLFKVTLKFLNADKQPQSCVYFECGLEEPVNGAKRPDYSSKFQRKTRT